MNAFKYSFKESAIIGTLILAVFILVLNLGQLTVRKVVVTIALSQLMDKHPEIDEQFRGQNIDSSEFVKCLKNQKFVNADNTTLCMTISAKT